MFRSFSTLRTRLRHRREWKALTVYDRFIWLRLIIRSFYIIYFGIVSHHEGKFSYSNQLNNCFVTLNVTGIEWAIFAHKLLNRGKTKYWTFFFWFFLLCLLFGGISYSMEIADVIVEYSNRIMRNYSVRCVPALSVILMLSWPLSQQSQTSLAKHFLCVPMRSALFWCINICFDFIHQIWAEVVLRSVAYWRIDDGHFQSTARDYFCENVENLIIVTCLLKQLCIFYVWMMNIACYVLEFVVGVSSTQDDSINSDSSNKKQVKYI